MRFTRSAEGALNFEQPPRRLEGHLVYLLQVLPFGTEVTPLKFADLPKRTEDGCTGTFYRES